MDEDYIYIKNAKQIDEKKETQVDKFLYGNSKIDIMNALEDCDFIQATGKFFDNSANIKFNEDMQEIIKNVYPSGNDVLLKQTNEDNYLYNDLLKVIVKTVTKEDFKENDDISLDMPLEQFNEDVEDDEEFTHVVAIVEERTFKKL